MNPCYTYTPCHSFLCWRNEDITTDNMFVIARSGRAKAPGLNGSLFWSQSKPPHGYFVSKSLCAYNYPIRTHTLLTHPETIATELNETALSTVVQYYLQKSQTPARTWICCLQIRLPRPSNVASLLTILFVMTATSERKLRNAQPATP